YSTGGSFGGRSRRDGDLLELPRRRVGQVVADVMAQVSVLPELRVGELRVHLVENPYLAAGLGLKLVQSHPADIAAVAAGTLDDDFGQMDDLLAIEPLEDVVESQQDRTVGIPAEGGVGDAEE